MGVVVVFRDVTQRRQTEQILRTSERLTLAGRLSATIAHEIRNPLDTVTNLVYLLQYEQAPNPTSAQYLQMASDELVRIAQITGQLLTFHREARSPVSGEPDGSSGKRADGVRSADQAKPHCGAVPLRHRSLRARISRRVAPGFLQSGGQCDGSHGPRRCNWCCIRASPAWLPIRHARAYG